MGCRLSSRNAGHHAWRTTAAAAAVVSFGSFDLAYGQTTGRERALENRIKYLEERLQRVEAILGTAAASRPARHAATQKPKAPAVEPDPPPIAQAANPPAAAPDQASASYSEAQPAPAPPAPGVGNADETPQELNVLRENAVTLKHAGIEVSSEVDYSRRETSLQNDRAVLSTTTLRYGVLDWLELSATLPAGYATRTTDIGVAQATTRTVSGLGDLVFQANARVQEQTSNWPGVVVSVGVIAPTGANPYDFSHYQLDSGIGAATPNPRNPLAYYYSQATWGAHSNFEFYKTMDPIILFFGFGLDYLFPSRISGYTIDGYTRFNYNLGLSFAVSEKTTLGFSVNGAYTPDLKVNGRDVFQSEGEPTLARLTVIQRVARNLFMEPSVSFGLDPDAPDFMLGLGLRARF